MTDPPGTLAKALERNLLNVTYDRPFPLLGLTLGQALGYPSDSNKPAFQGVGSVPGGSAQCNREVKLPLASLGCSR